MNLNHSCGTNAFLIKFYPDVVQSLYLLSLKLTLSAYQTEIPLCKLDTFHCRKCFSQRLSASKHRNKTTSTVSHERNMFLRE
jgi:hypothetical protein